MEESLLSKDAHNFTQLASFGKRMEFAIIAEMLKEELDIYRPLVDDKGIDCIMRREDGTIAEIQIKARSANIQPNNAARFSAISHIPSPNYWFVFHSAMVGRTGTMWIMHSYEFIKYAAQNKNGSNIGKYSICLHGLKMNSFGEPEPYPNPKFAKFICNDFSRIVQNRVFVDEI